MARGRFGGRRAGRIGGLAARIGALTARLFGLSALLVVLACDGYPRDPEGTLDRAAGGVLRVGVAEAQPSLTRAADGTAAGPEAELIAAFAGSIGARVDWRWGGLDEHLAALERRELDVVAGGLAAKSPWSAHVAFTRPWRKEGDVERVLAVAPGENATLVALDRVVEARKAAAQP